MTLNGVIALILRYFSEFVGFRAHCLKVVEDIPKLLIQKCSPRYLVFSDITMISYRKAFRRGG